jgi:hypothetical protein
MDKTYLDNITGFLTFPLVPEEVWAEIKKIEEETDRLTGALSNIGYNVKIGRTRTSD